MDEQRIPPEELLPEAEREEHRKGRLKIFLGMAAGVGKTYAMLEEAQKLKKEEVDLVVGTVDTHGRAETAKLLEGLETIAEKQLEYKGITFKQLDLDAVVKRKPSIVLVDELAHQNIPGSLHPKRWMDVMELLDKGIDVYTTLNIQHIESLKDIVESIAGIKIQEQVPDKIVETADSIALIDLTPQELLQRLREKKVYTGDLSEIAVRNFFRPDRLTALREIVLRFAAEKIHHDLHGKVFKWKMRERLLVAIGPSPHSQKLIRTARRLAFSLDAPWFAVYVNDGKKLSDEGNELLDKNISLARDLGAEIITLSDPDVAGAILRIAKQKAVTQIIIGRSVKKGISHFFKKIELYERLSKECEDIDVHVIREARPSFKLRKKLFAFHWPKPFPYIIAFFIGILLALLNAALLPYIGFSSCGFLFLLAILGQSWFFQKGPLLFASFFYAFLWDYFFIPPIHSLLISSGEDRILIILYFFSAILLSIFTDKAKKQKKALLQREKTMHMLFEIMHDISSAPTSKFMLDSVKERLGNILNGSCEIFTKQPDGKLVFEGAILQDEKEKNAAIWSCENGKEAGWSTTTLPSVQNLYLPLKGYYETVGVLAYRPKNDTPLSNEEKNFLYTVCQELAYAFEKSFSEEKIRKVKEHYQIEKILQTILKLTSSEFKNPILQLNEAIDAMQGQEKKVEFNKITQAAEQLTWNFNNISALAQLSTGSVKIEIKKQSIEPLIQDCAKKIKNKLAKHRLNIKIEEGIPLIPFDFALLDLLLCNLLINAIEYSPPESLIEIEAKVTDHEFILSVADEGRGIPPDMLDLVFKKFYRLPGTTPTGMGLGLSIAKAIAELHKGRLKAENRKPTGTIFSLFLPL